MRHPSFSAVSRRNTFVPFGRDFFLTPVVMFVASRMTGAEIRQWVTPFVMRYLIHCLEQGQRVLTKEELLHAGIHLCSVEALIQTRRLAPLADQADSYEITIDS